MYDTTTSYAMLTVYLEVAGSVLVSDAYDVRSIRISMVTHVATRAAASERRPVNS